MTFIPLAKPKSPPAKSVDAERLDWQKSKLEQAVAGLLGAADIVIDLAPVPEQFDLVERVAELEEFLRGWLSAEGLPTEADKLNVLFQAACIATMIMRYSPQTWEQAGTLDGLDEAYRAAVLAIGKIRREMPVGATMAAPRRPSDG